MNRISSFKEQVLQVENYKIYTCIERQQKIPDGILLS